MTLGTAGKLRTVVLRKEVRGATPPPGLHAAAKRSHTLPPASLLSAVCPLVGYSHGNTEEKDDLKPLVFIWFSIDSTAQRNVLAQLRHPLTPEESLGMQTESEFGSSIVCS